MIDSKEIIKKLNFISLLLVVFTLPFSVWWNGFFVIFFYSTSIALVIIEKDLTKKQWRNKFTLIFTSHFFIYFLVVTLSGFSHSHGFILEKKLTLLLFPLFLGMGVLKYGRSQIELLLKTFVMSVFVAALLPFFFHPYYLLHPDITVQDYLMMDRPYFALYAFSCVFILVFLISMSRKMATKILLALIGSYLIYFTYIIFAKMVFIAFIFTIIVGFGVYFIQQKRFKYLLIYSSSLLIAFLGLIVLNKNLQSFLYGVITMQPFDMKDGKWVFYLSINTRYVIWSCSYDLLMDGYNWIFGCGLDYQGILDSCYDQNWERFGVRTSEGVDPLFLESHFNPHCEFLQTWIETGIIGLIALLVSIGCAIKIALEKRNYLYLSFTLFFLACCLTESFLTRQKGIVLYALFNSLFAFQMETETKQT